jgi:hypothetical protein
MIAEEVQAAKVEMVTNGLTEIIMLEVVVVETTMATEHNL